MDKKDIAKRIGKDLSTLYNWEKTNPELYNAIFSYYNNLSNSNEFLELFKKLSEAEQEYIKAEIKMLISRKEI